jgi:hypothetical protein
MLMRRLVVAAMISAVSFSVFAEAPAGKPGGGLSAEEKEKICKENPDRCARMKENMEKRKAMRAECEKSPDTCKEKREAFHKEQTEKRKEMHAEMKAKCEADPKACAAKKAEMREKMQERREKMKAGGGQSSEKSPAVK